MGRPTIAAAGVIVAGSFAALRLTGDTLLSQTGFAIAFGMLIAAFATATFFFLRWPASSGMPPAQRLPCASSAATGSRRRPRVC